MVFGELGHTFTPEVTRLLLYKVDRHIDKQLILKNLGVRLQVYGFVKQKAYLSSE